MVRRSNYRDLFRIQVRRMMEEVAQKNVRGFLDLSPEILIKIFQYVGTMNPGDYNISEEIASTSKRNDNIKEEIERTFVKGMLSLRKVCRHFSFIIDSYAYYLPKFLLRGGVRIRSKPCNAEHGMVVIYRYGWKEKVAICTPVSDIPIRMSHFKIGGRLVIDDLFVDDNLITALTHVDLSKVREVLFTRIIGVELRSETSMLTFLDQVRFAKSIRFFGNFCDDELFLNDPTVNEIIERNKSDENSYLDASKLDAIYRKSIGTHRKQRDKARRRAFNKRLKRIAKEEPLD